MESEKLVALLCSAVSELIILVLLLFPEATPLSVPSPDRDSLISNYSSHFPHPFAGLLPLLVGCLLARLEKVNEFPAFPRKRKKTRVLDYESGSYTDSNCGSSLSRPGSQPGRAEIFINRPPISSLIRSG
ncbi:hypothetical protein MLD38_013783 [Melastoma candidum]|uniref:Uncharacterized protein n=1 Tax=Melastoma candidum TaxID=119954 RepID=A0ACB9RA34_9MYRT|nr:hypothetical protein MLD38_013783 [Melastoma candidum]